MTNNLSDVANPATARFNLGAAPLASPAFTGTPTAPTASAGTNTTQLATTAFVLANGGSGVAVNLARNGSFAIAQRTMPTTDNSYSLDGWRLLLENANGATITQDTGDVPTGAGYAAKMVVGSGNNGKFGLFSPIENKDTLSLRGGVVSLRVPLKATAGLTDGTGKIRIGILQWIGTADNGGTAFPDPVTTWGAEGTNPTLSGSWAFANTPAAISVTTSWADYLVENVSISSSATNVAIMIWSDDRATTATTDILRVGGYVTLTKGATAASAIAYQIDDEVRKCLRFFEKSYNLGVAPGTSDTIGNAVAFINGPTYDGQSTTLRFASRKYKTPVVTLYSNTTGASGKIHDTVGGDISISAGNVGDGGFSVSLYPLTSSTSHVSTFHWTADADL